MQKKTMIWLGECIFMLLRQLLGRVGTRDILNMRKTYSSILVSLFSFKSVSIFEPPFLRDTFTDPHIIIWSSHHKVIELRSQDETNMQVTPCETNKRAPPKNSLLKHPLTVHFFLTCRKSFKHVCPPWGLLYMTSAIFDPHPFVWILCSGFLSQLMVKLRDWAVRPVRAGWYPWAASSLIDSKTLYCLSANLGYFLTSPLCADVIYGSPPYSN